jgi:hypothetical protein
VFELASQMNAASFLKDINQNDVPFLYHCIVQNNNEALETLAQLPYFKELVNHDFNEEGWTPLL